MCNKHDDQDDDKMNTLAFVNIDFTRQNFPNPDSFIFYHQNFVPYGICIPDLIYQT